MRCCARPCARTCLGTSAHLTPALLPPWLFACSVKGEVKLTRTRQAVPSYIRVACSSSCDRLVHALGQGYVSQALKGLWPY